MPAALDFAAHARQLLRGRDGGTACLDGIRSTLCIWLVLFHTFVYSHNYGTLAEMNAIAASPQFYLLDAATAVDGFFVLTGLLIAWPYLKRSASTDKPALSLRETYFRRLARIWPIYAVCVWLTARVLFPRGLLPADEVRLEFNLRMKEVVFPHVQLDYWPSGCEHGMFVANLLLWNNLVPAGGCMGHTWSMSVQFHFYLLAPLVFWALGVRRALRAFVVLFVVSVATRVLAFYTLLTYVPQEEDIRAFLLHFMFYMHSVVRLNGILLGVAVAWLSATDAGLQYVAALRRRRWLVSAAWFSIIAWLLLRGSMARTGSAGSVPGQEIVEAVQADPDGPTTLRMLHFVFAGGVGSPLSGLAYAFLVLGTMHQLGSVGRVAHAIWSHPAWHPVSCLSFIAYLMHPAVAQKLFATLWKPPTMEPNAMLFYCFANLALTFLLAVPLYIFVEMPCTHALRASKSPRWRAVGFWYFAILGGLSYLAQLVLLLPIVPHQVKSAS